MKWASRRRLIYLVLFLLPVFLIGGLFLFLYLGRPTCSDGAQNQDEIGVDCGGVCMKVCKENLVDPVVLWSQEFPVAAGVYNSVALVENPNFGVEAESIPYTFKFYDERGILITERMGNAYIPPGTAFPIFEHTIVTGEKIPSRTTFQFTRPPEWRDVALNHVSLEIYGERLTSLESTPRLDARIRNKSDSVLSDIAVIAILYDERGNAVAASQTFVEELERGEEDSLVFTWPVPFEIEPGICKNTSDVVLLIDRSGSMNDDGDNPPQPLTKVKEAASLFLNLLGEQDRIGVVSFATEASDPPDAELSFSKPAVESAIIRLSISPEEEGGFTNLGDAVKKAVELFARERVGQEDEVRKVLIALTDGEANYPQEPDGELYAYGEVLEAKNKGIDIYTIGLGEEVNETFLRRIASDEKYHYTAPTADELSRIYSDIATTICDKGPYVIDIIPIVHIGELLQ